MTAPQYTTCVDRHAYEAPDFGPEIFVAIAGLIYAISTFGISIVLSMAAAMSALMKVCDYILRGKLVCLGDDECAVGRVAGFETVADKSGVDKLDNDFSINLVLAPHHLSEFAQGTQQANYEWLRKDTSWGFDDLPGRLITEQADMPMPREAESASWHSARYAGTFVTYSNSNYISWEDAPTPGTPFDVPVFHCEIEGERAHAVCSTLAAITSPIPGWGAVCGFKPFGIPIGRWACALVAAVLAPIVLAALAAAWIAGADDNRSFEGAGSLRRGESIIIRGRWCYDAGHTGWNEIHPVRSVQKLAGATDLDGGLLKDALARWCARTGEVPPPASPGARPTGMTPAQGTVYDNQQRPENQWVLHPDVDGCAPTEPPPVIK